LLKERVTLLSRTESPFMTARIASAAVRILDIAVCTIIFTVLT
jgi:hypothetical protein